MSVRPIFWLLLAISCLGVLLIAIMAPISIPAVMQVHLRNLHPASTEFTTVELHLADTEGLPLEKADLSPSSALLPTSHQQDISPSTSLPSVLEVLTSREREVLILVAEGWTNQEIATHLNLSIKTVQAHRANVMEKLGLHDVTHLVRFAIQHGLIPAES